MVMPVVLAAALQVVAHPAGPLEVAARLATFTWPAEVDGRGAGAAVATTGGQQERGEREDEPPRGASSVGEHAAIVPDTGSRTVVANAPLLDVVSAA